MNRAVWLGWAWVLTTSLCAATEVYVTPRGAGAADGTSWENAYSNVQDAVDDATGIGDVIYLKGGTYTNADAITVSNVPGLTIRGGYEGSGTPPGGGPTTDVATVLTRGASNARILYGTGSTVTLERVTVSGGTVVDDSGGGLLLSGCDVLLTNCVVRSCRVVASVAGNRSGGAVYATGGQLSIWNSLVVSNELRSPTSATYQGYRYYGGAIRASGTRFETGASTYLANRFDGRTCWFYMYGGAIYSSASEFLVTGCLFEANSAQGNYAAAGTRGYGGALALGSGAGAIADCTFDGNYVWNLGSSSICYGGAIWCGGAGAVDCARLDFLGNYVLRTTTGSLRGSAMYLSGGAAHVNMIDCSVDTGGMVDAGDTIRVESSASLAIVNTTLRDNAAQGVYFSGTSLGLTNCLIARSGSDAVRVTAGTASLRGCTLADSAGWGLNRSAGTVALEESIAWGNGAGGITSNADVTVTYSCCQNEVNGADNLYEDPRFFYTYYLEQAGLAGQTQTSPCVDAGNGTAAERGVATRTTRTDGAGDDGQVDLGYHYTNSVDSAAFSNLTLYVDAAAGDDGNDGWGPGEGAALQTIGEALERVLRGGTVHVATGRYDTALGEVFPLTIGKPNVSLLGADRAMTVVDADTSERVLYAANGGQVWLEGLTFEGGRVANGDGGGLYLWGCNTEQTNCALWDCQASASTYGLYTHGGGIHAAGGTLTILDSVVATNTMRVAQQGGYHYGGGVYVSGDSFVTRGSTYRGNQVYRAANCWYRMYGGAIYSSASAMEISDCAFEANRAYHNYPGAGAWVYGGCVFVGSGVAKIERCRFLGNYAYHNGAGGSAVAWGGALYVNGGSTYVCDSTFSGNYVEMIGTGTGRGGVLYAGGGLAGCMACVATNNGASNRGDVWVAGGTLGLTNCLVAGNTSDGVRGSGGVLALASCTVADNVGWGVTNSGAAGTLRNCIAWGNTTGGIATNTGDTVTHTCSQETQQGEGNKQANPVFAGAGQGDYTLRGGSPCIDAGVSDGWMNGAVDLAGHARVVGGGVDMGCYESLVCPGMVLLFR